MDTLIQRFYYALRDWTARPDERGKRHSGVWQSKVRDKVLEMCQYETGRLLEIGCGEGIFLSTFVKSNHQARVWGLEVREDMLNLAKAALSGKDPEQVCLVQGQAQTLPFENDYFDTVVAANLFICLKGLEDARAVVMEAARVLKPGGRFIAEFRNKANPLLWAKYKFAKFYDATLKDHPLSTYSIVEMKAVFILAGFDVSAEICLEFPFNKLAPIIIFEAKKRE